MDSTLPARNASSTCPGDCSPNGARTIQPRVETTQSALPWVGSTKQKPPLPRERGKGVWEASCLLCALSWHVELSYHVVPFVHFIHRCHNAYAVRRALNHSRKIDVWSNGCEYSIQAEPQRVLNLPAWPIGNHKHSFTQIPKLNQCPSVKVDLLLFPPKVRYEKRPRAAWHNPLCDLSRIMSVQELLLVVLDAPQPRTGNVGRSGDAEHNQSHNNPLPHTWFIGRFLRSLRSFAANPSP